MKKFILLTICLFASFTAFSQTITSSSSGNWADGSTWVGGNAPASGNDVVIAHNVTCNSVKTANSLTVNAGVTLTVGASGNLTITNAVTDNGTILVTGSENTSGSFIAKAATGVTNLSVKIFVPRSDGSTPDNWKLVGIPVNGETVGDIDDNLATNGSKVGIGKWDHESNSWDLYTTSETASVLPSNVGYEMLYKASGGAVSYTHLTLPTTPYV